MDSFLDAPDRNGTVWSGSTAGFGESTDGGSSWSLRNAGLRATDVNAIATAKGSRTLYACANVPAWGFSGYSRGAGTLQKSTDAGESWTALDLGSADGFLSSVAVSPVAPERVLLGTQGLGLFNQLGEVHRSEDAGASWRLSASLRGWVQAIGFDPLSPERVFAATRFSDGDVRFGGLFRSADSGRSFSRLTSLDTYWVSGLALLPTPPATTVFLPPFRSTDGGDHWTVGSFRSGSNDSAIFAVDPRDPLTVYQASLGVFKSTDAGLTWADASNGLWDPFGTGQDWVTALDLDPSQPDKLYAARGGKVFRSTDAGGSWSAYLNAIPGTTIATLVARDGVLFAGTSRGLFRTASDPSITSVSPATGSTRGGTLLMIRGAGFTRDSRVAVGGVPATDLTFFDEGTIRVRTGPHASGLVSMQVDVPDAPSALLADSFSYEDWTGRCAASESMLCLAERFSIEVRWTDAEGAHPSHAVSLTERSGVFWFSYGPSVELAVKVLDGRTLNAHYWIHLAGLTELAYEVSVTDAVTGAKRTYTHPAGAVVAILDKESF